MTLYLHDDRSYEKNQHKPLEVSGHATLLMLSQSELTTLGVFNIPQRLQV